MDKIYKELGVYKRKEKQEKRWPVVNEVGRTDGRRENGVFDMLKSQKIGNIAIR